jgi:CRP-like cAMP-binding protein
MSMRIDRHVRTGERSPLNLLAACSRRDLRVLDRVSTFLHVDAGRVLCREGELGHECFIVLDGCARVLRGNEEIATIRRGEPIGEVALLGPHARRTASVIAVTPMDLLVLSRRELSQLVSDTQSMGLQLIRFVTARLVAPQTVFA